MTEIYKTVKLSRASKDYRIVQEQFYRTIPRCGSSYLKQIRQIERIQNPFLYAHYQLKKAHERRIHGHVTEQTLYHGTRNCSVNSICKNNFSKFGWGAFSSSARYASGYPQRHHDALRVMFVVKVLKVSRCTGASDLLIPSRPFNVSTKSDGDVVINDYEFYPEYIIRYDSLM
ncbi:hypothetical protein JTB14_003544 [Gonioctena quinquepunctata]|nr:hypothetical protein JTB14_003544 [Gonioctena quinquepunctata]